MLICSLSPPKSSPGPACRPQREIVAPSPADYPKCKDAVRENKKPRAKNLKDEDSKDLLGKIGNNICQPGECCTVVLHSSANEPVVCVDIMDVRSRWTTSMAVPASSGRQHQDARFQQRRARGSNR